MVLPQAKKGRDVQGEAWNVFFYVKSLKSNNNDQICDVYEKSRKMV